MYGTYHKLSFDNNSLKIGLLLWPYLNIAIDSLDYNTHIGL